MIWIGILGFIIGSCIGSFVSATSGRVIEGESILGRSYCPRCKKTLRWYDLFPIFSYLFLQGKCRLCHKSIPAEYLLVEVISGLCIALLFLQEGHFLLTIDSLMPAQLWQEVLNLIFKIFVVAVLEILFIIDLKIGLLPDRVTYPSMIIAVIYLIGSALFQSLLFYQSLQSHTLGKYLMPPYSSYLYDHLIRLWMIPFSALLSGVLLASLFILLIIITRGKGMGWGDVKYVLFLGLAIGFPNILVGIFISFFLGAFISLVLIMVNKKRFGQTVPFGPFLSLGCFIALLWGDEILSWYLSFSPGLF